MSTLFGDIFAKVTTDFQKAEAIIEKVWANVVKVVPVLQTDAAAAVSALKQQASNAFAYVDTELAPHFADATSMVESAADTLIMGLTKGYGGPLLPLANVGISQGFAILHAALDHAEAEAKSKFDLPPVKTDAQPTVAAVTTAVAEAIQPAQAA